MKKRLLSRSLSLILALSMLFSFSALAAPDAPSSDPSAPTTSPTPDPSEGEEEGGGNSGGEVTTPPIIHVKLSSNTLEAYLGEAAPTLTAKASIENPPTDSTPTISYEWKSSNEAYLKVTGDTDGTATLSIIGVNPTPPTTITVTAKATVGGKELTATDECAVTVYHAKVTGITLEPSSGFNVDVNKTKNVTATLSPEGASPSELKWSVDKTEIATYSETDTPGTVMITGKTPGEATLTAAAGGKTATCPIKVSGVKLDQSSLSLIAGGTATLKAESFGDASKTFEWLSNNTGVVQISSSSGSSITVNAIGEGTTTITASAGGYSASCEVTVKANTAGVITGSADAGRPLKFSSMESQMDDRCRSVLNASLDHVSGISVPTSAGTLYYKYVSADNPGAGVGSTATYYLNGDNGSLLSDITFVPLASFSGTAEISYTGYSSSGASFKGSIQVTVEKVNDVVYSTGLNTPVSFSAGDFNTVARSRLGRDMSYVTFTLPTDTRGVLYYRYSKTSTYNTPVDASTHYNLNGVPLLSDITFVPAKDYSGTVNISYTCYDNSSNSYTGRVSVNVATSSSSSGSLDYSVAKNKTLSFSASNFNTACRDAIGETLDRVQFSLPDSSRGTLYYDYKSSGSYDHKVTSSNYYYRNSSYYLSTVDFVPANNYTGTVSISFTGWGVDGGRFTGTVTIKVGSGSGSGDINYSTDRNQPVTFDAGDFSDACRDATGENLDYVRFTLPASSKGTLYYNYSSSGNYDSKVSSSTDYYRSSKPYLYNVSFVPANNYTGTASIKFTGYSTSGTRFTGTVDVTVGDGGSLTYSTAMNQAVKFVSNDFNDACDDETSQALSYVRFEQPSSSKGALYYNYSSSSSSNTKVSESTNYNRSSSPSISNISFVPATDYTGTVEIDFTGWSTSGTRFTGVVTVTVGSGTSQKVSYSVTSGKSVTFSDDDFNNVSKDATSTALRYVRFELPNASQGVLYYNYSSSSGASSDKVSASTSYYRNSTPYLDQVSFVPTSGFSGTVSIPYTGWNTDGDKFTGTVDITVKPGPSASVIRYTAGATPVTFQSQDFVNACSSRQEGSLASVRFTLPDSSFGRLYYDYTGPSKYDSVVKAATSYSPAGTPTISKVTFLPRAGFQGTVPITYTGTDSSGQTYTGTVEISVYSSSTTASHFTDLANYAWAAPSIEFLYQGGVVTGSGSQFNAGSSITRGDFTLMLYRAYQFEGAGDGFSDVPADSYYAKAISAAKALGIVQGTEDGKFHPTQTLTRQDAMVMLQRAMRGVGWSLSDGSASSLSYYPDASSVSDYAVGAVACMVQYDIIRGTSSGTLSPKSPITRGEMAVILHRALTL